MLGITRDGRKTLKKEKEKRKMRKCQTTTITFYLLLPFYIEKFVRILRNNIWKNLIYIVTFVLQFFREVGYWICSDKAPTPNGLVL